MSFGQGGPGWGPGGSNTPDWNALAESAEAARARRRRWLLIGGGALATVAVAAVVAVAVVSAGDGSASDDESSALPTPESLPSSPAQPEPSFETEAPPPPPDPMEFISDPKKDTAPLSVKTLYPDKKITVNDRTFARATTDATKNCAGASREKLGPVLTANKCREMYRATYTRDDLAVTVGIAVFDSEKAAEKAKDDAAPSVAPLSGGGTPQFCRFSACYSSANSIGRYAYFVVSGYPGGKDVTAKDTKARTVGRDIAQYAFVTIRERGEAQASAAATASPR